MVVLSDKISSQKRSIYGGCHERCECFAYVDKIRCVSLNFLLGGVWVIFCEKKCVPCWDIHSDLRFSKQQILFSTLHVGVSFLETCRVTYGFIKQKISKMRLLSIMRVVVPLLKHTEWLKVKWGQNKQKVALRFFSLRCALVETYRVSLGLVTSK